MKYSSEPRPHAEQKAAQSSAKQSAKHKDDTAFVDKRASTAALSQLKAMMDASPRHTNLRNLTQLTAGHAASSAAPVQKLEHESLATGEVASANAAQWRPEQQAPSRAKPALQVKGVALNDVAGLEPEAGVAAAKAQAVGVQHVATRSAATGQFKPAAPVSSSPPVQRLYNTYALEAGKPTQIDKQDLVLTAAFKEKHVATDAAGAQANTKARVDSGGPAVILNGTKPNTCATEAEWLNAVHETKTAIPLSGAYKDHIPITLSSGWATTHKAGAYAQAALNNQALSIGVEGRELKVGKKGEIVVKVDVKHIGDA